MFFRDKVIWLTGASSGIGEGLAYALAQENARLILSARRVEALEAVRAKCVELSKGDPARCVVLPLDLEDLESLPDKAAHAHALFGRIDMLILAGGVSMRGYVLDTELHVHQRLMQVNYFGKIALARAVLPMMIEQHGGHIVVVSSLQARLPVPGRSGYTAAHHALNGFFDVLRAEVARYNIKVTVACAGFVQTHISENALLPDGSRRGGVTDKEHRKAMTPAESARHILNAVRRGKEEVYYGGAERWAIYARRFFPGLYARAIRRIRLSM